MSELSQAILAAKKKRGLALLPFIAAGYPKLGESMQKGAILPFCST